MKRNACAVVFILWCAHALCAQDFLQGYAASGQECASSLTVSPSGQITVAGLDFLTNHSIVLRLSSTGSLESARQLASQGSDEAQTVLQTPDNGQIVVGSIQTSAASDGLIFKLNAAGTVGWKKTFGSAADDHFVNIVQTTDRKFVVLGYTINSVTSSDIVVVKYNSSGGVLWKKTFGTNDFDHASGITATSDNGVLVSVATTVPNGINTLLVKMNSAGTIQWARFYGTSGFHIAGGVVQTSDGSFYFAERFAQTSNSQAGAVLAKLDSTGSLIWTKQYRASGFSLNAQALLPSPDGGVFLFGNMDKSANNGKGVLIRVDSTGKVLWRKSIKPDSRPVFLGHTVLDPNGTLLAVGCAGSRTNPSINMDIFTLRLEPDGNFQGGCGGITSFGIATSNFALPTRAASLNQPLVTYTTGSPTLTTTTLHPTGSRVCPAQ